MAGRQQKTTGKTTKASSGRKTTAKGKKISEKKVGVTPEGRSPCYSCGEYFAGIE